MTEHAPQNEVAPDPVLIAAKQKELNTARMEKWYARFGIVMFGFFTVAEICTFLGIIAAGTATGLMPFIGVFAFGLLISTMFEKSAADRQKALTQELAALAPRKK